jgi:hypothetical protein
MSKTKDAEIARINLALEFVSLVAGMKQDGEVDDDGNEFEMTIEDAFMTVDNLIATARRIEAGEEKPKLPKGR